MPLGESTIDMDPANINIIEILTSLGGGAAVTAVAWTLLYIVWRRFEVANQSRIDDLVYRAKTCEDDRRMLRNDLTTLSGKMHDLERTQIENVTEAIERNTRALEKLHQTVTIN